MSNIFAAGMTDKVDPVSRIEGHLGIEVKVEGGIITDAASVGNLWRGFENFLLGREVNDAITFVQRICGVCPVPHGLTSTHAVDNVLGYSEGHITFKFDGEFGVPLAAIYIRNLVLAAEWMMSSITHFYHLAAPSYVQGPEMAPWTPYFADSYYTAALRKGANALPADNNEDTTDADITVWQAVIASYVKALAIRRKIFEATALYAGRMPMTSCFVGGGVTNNFADAKADTAKFISLMQEVQAFVVREYVPIALTLSALAPYDTYDNTHNGGDGIGAGTKRYLSWGALPMTNNALLVPGGVAVLAAADDNGIDEVTPFTVASKADVALYFLAASGLGSVPGNLTEEIGKSWFGDTLEEYTDDAAYPGAVTRTEPNRDKTGAYSYMKAPRWEQQPCEVGPMARCFVAGWFADGQLLAGTVPGYVEYTNELKGLSPAQVVAALTALPDDAARTAFLATLTLDTSMIAPGILAALDNAGLVATVQSHIIGLKAGASTMDRLRARAIEALVLSMGILGTSGIFNPLGLTGWANELAALPDGSDTYIPKVATAAAQGWGATEAPRGALMHQASVDETGRITAYQCIVPTTWNGGPTDARGGKGPFEAAVIGAPFAKTAKVITGPSGASVSTVGDVEVLRIAQSFDPCIACAVH